MAPSTGAEKRARNPPCRRQTKIPRATRAEGLSKLPAGRFPRGRGLAPQAEPGSDSPKVSLKIVHATALGHKNRIYVQENHLQDDWLTRHTHPKNFSFTKPARKERELYHRHPRGPTSAWSSRLEESVGETIAVSSRSRLSVRLLSVQFSKNSKSVERSRRCARDECVMDGVLHRVTRIGDASR